MHVAAFVDGKRTETCSAEQCCLLKNGIEYRTQIAARTVDYFQNFCRRGLLDQELFTLGTASLQPLLELSDGLFEIGQF